MMVFLSVWQSGRRPRLVWLRSGRLPVVIPVQFEWLEVRRQMGLVVSGQNITEPLLPAPATGGRWTRLPLPVSEAAAWLRSLLEGLVTTGDIRVGTHSCGDATFVVCQEGLGPRAAQAVGISCSEGRQVFGHLFSR